MFLCVFRKRQKINSAWQDLMHVTVCFWLHPEQSRKEPAVFGGMGHTVVLRSTSSFCTWAVGWDGRPEVGKWNTQVSLPDLCSLLRISVQQLEAELALARVCNQSAECLAVVGCVGAIFTQRSLHGIKKWWFCAFDVFWSIFNNCPLRAQTFELFVLF